MMAIKVGKFSFLNYFFCCRNLTSVINIASNAMTGRCQVVVLPDYCAVPTLLTAVFDTLVFLAISYRMVFNNAFGNTWRVRASSFFTGHGLYSMSKALLQSGQIYYL